MAGKQYGARRGRLTEEEKKFFPQLFKPGQSGNPAGRPPDDPEIKEILRAASPAAARRLVELSKSPAERISLQACNSILDRVLGKPSVAVQVEQTGDTMNDLRAMIRELLMERKLPVSIN